RLQGAAHRRGTHGLAVTLEDLGDRPGHDPGAGAARDAEAHHADRLAGCGAARPGDAGGGQGQVGARHHGQHAAGHFHGDLLADGSEAFQGIGRYPQLFDLGRVAVGDEAALEPQAGARARRDGPRPQPTGAGFRRGAQPARRAQRGAHLARQGARSAFGHDSNPSRTSSAPASKAYRAATISSIMTPKPFLKRRSSRLAGGGLTMSKKRNSATETAWAQNPGGISHSTSQMATISSQLMPP